MSTGIPPVKDLTAGSKILMAVKDNQLLTAAVLFLLWEMNLFNSVIGYGCGF